MKPTLTAQKLRGGYYTPQPIADFLAAWAVQGPRTRVLEPSCGDGALVAAAARRLCAQGASVAEAARLIQGVELDPVEATLAEARLYVTLADTIAMDDVAPATSPSPIHVGDFFAFCKATLNSQRRFDAVIGNPPFIRYQNFPEEYRQIAFYLMQVARLHPNRLTNAWAPFLVAATQLLAPGGRVAMVIPAELLQVNYAAELRYFLSQHYSNITLVTFRKLVFEGIQQEVVLFLGERDGSAQTGIRTIEVDGVGDLCRLETASFTDRPIKAMDHSTEKWTMYFLDDDELALLRRLREHPRLTPAASVLDVDVGVVTGLNEFFVVGDEQADAHGLDRRYLQPLVGRSTYLDGLFFTEDDWRRMAAKQAPSLLLTLPDAPLASLPAAEQRYVAYGQQHGWHTGYKCRIRKRWYVTPSVWAPQAFLLRQIHSYPRLIVNTAGAISTDTIHRVRMRQDAQPAIVAAAFLNTLTFAFTEVIGRSYGGGLLELEPNEAERLPLPLVGAETLDAGRLDDLQRAGDIGAILDITDRTLLREGLGLSAEETRMLRRIWEKLRNRRINRKPDAAMRRSSKELAAV